MNIPRYRAYDKKKKRLWSSDNVGFFSGNLVICGFPTYFWQIPRTSVSDVVPLDQRERFEIMRYSQHKDCFGELICEGDYLQGLNNKNFGGDGTVPTGVNNPVTYDESINQFYAGGRTLGSFLNEVCTTGTVRIVGNIRGGFDFSKTYDPPEESKKPEEIEVSFKVGSSDIHEWIKELDKRIAMDTVALSLAKMGKEWSEHETCYNLENLKGFLERIIK